MKDFKSVQDLIIKAALYDGISTTISAEEMLGVGDVLKITFSRKNRYSATHIDLTDGHRNPEEVALYACKDALYRLFKAPYEEIEYVRER